MKSNVFHEIETVSETHLLYYFSLLLRIQFKWWWGQMRNIVVCGILKVVTTSKMLCTIHWAPTIILCSNWINFLWEILITLLRILQDIQHNIGIHSVLYILLTRYESYCLSHDFWHLSVLCYTPQNIYVYSDTKPRIRIYIPLYIGINHKYQQMDLISNFF